MDHRRLYAPAREGHRRLYAPARERASSTDDSTLQRESAAIRPRKVPHQICASDVRWTGKKMAIWRNLLYATRIGRNKWKIVGLATCFPRYCGCAPIAGKAENLSERYLPKSCERLEGTAAIGNTNRVKNLRFSFTQIIIFFHVFLSKNSSFCVN